MQLRNGNIGISSHFPPVASSRPDLMNWRNTKQEYTESELPTQKHAWKSWLANVLMLASLSVNVRLLIHVTIWHYLLLVWHTILIGSRHIVYQHYLFVFTVIYLQEADDCAFTILLYDDIWRDLNLCCFHESRKLLQIISNCICLTKSKACSLPIRNCLVLLVLVFGVQQLTHLWHVDYQIHLIKRCQGQSYL